nr:zinc finger, CCHC-type [Tanacetum cinerariifolium]
MISTGPDLAYAVSRLCRYTSNPSNAHWKAMTRVLHYLRYSHDYGLHYDRHPAVIEGYNDANWISDIKDSRSTSGYVFTLGGATISWKSSKQTVIAKSMMESKFIALDKCGGGMATSIRRGHTKVTDSLTIHTLLSPHVASFHPKDMYFYYHPCIDDPKKHYGFKPGLLRQSRSLVVDFLNMEMIEDDWHLEPKEVSFLGEGLNLPVRPKELDKGVTTRGGKTTTQDAQNNDDSVDTEKPHAINQDKPIESDEVLTNDQPQKANESVTQPTEKI